MKKYLPVISCLLFFFAFEGCAPTKATFNATVNPEISREKISNIAIMPFTGIEANKTNLGKIDTTVMNAFEKKKIKTKITGSYFASNKLDKSLITDWETFSNGYAHGKSANVKLISQIGKDLKADGIVQGSVSNIIQHNAEYGAKFGDTKATLTINLFSAATGKLLWSATSQGTVGTLTTNDPAPPVINAVAAAVKEIFLNFPIK